MPSGRPRYPGLTPREQEVFDLLRQGLTNREIAERLGISLDGAKYHVSQILMKLDVSTREEAVALTTKQRVFGLAGFGALLRKLTLGGLMKTSTVAVLFGAIVVVALIAIGVLVTQTQSEDDTAQELPLTLDGEPSKFLALLEHLPAAGDGQLHFNDYAAVREIRGIQLPSRDASSSETVAYWSSLSDAGMYSHPISIHLTNRAEDHNLEQGFNLTALDQSLSWTTIPPACGGRSVVFGRFDQVELDHALRQTSSFRDVLAIERHGGVPFYAWHEDCGVPGAGRRPGFPEGPWPNAPGRLVADDRIVYWTSDSTAAIEGMIDASTGAAPSLTSQMEYQLLAQSFEELGVFSAYAQVHSNPFWFEPLRELAENEYGRNAPNTVQSQGYLRPYVGLAIGVGHDDEGTYAVLLFLHTNDEDAAANADILQLRVDSGTRYRGRPWSDIIHRSEIEVDGAVLRAKFWGPDPKFLLQAWYDLDSLFVSKP